MTFEEAIEYIGNHYLAYIPFLQENREQIKKHNDVMDIAIECIEKQIELQDFISRLDPVMEETLIVILKKYLVDTDVSQNG